MQSIFNISTLKSFSAKPVSIHCLRSVTVVAALIGSLFLVGCEKSTEAEQAATETTTTESMASMDTADAALIATTQYGQVRGFVDDGVNVFKGIRYGADTATARFQAPQPPRPWDDVKDALEYGNSTRQIPTGSGGGLFEDWKSDPAPALSEDSLFLNVWTPALRDAKKRP